MSGHGVTGRGWSSSTGRLLSGIGASVYQGDAHEVLSEMPTGSVNCIITSPPYYGLRDYGPGQIGQEPTPGAYIEALRTAFAEARRVLASDGTLWLNLGDVTVGWEVHEDDPKSEAGGRTLFLDDLTAEVVDVHLRLQEEERRRWGDGWMESGYAFTKDNGEPLHPAWVSDEFHRLAFEAGLPPIRLHDLRHGTATHALSAGVAMKVVQEILGHADESVTSGTYTSVADELKRDAANAIAGLIQAAKGAARTDHVLPVSHSDSHEPESDAGSPS